MARLKAGQKPETLPNRMSRYLKTLKEDGGHRLVANLDKETHDDLKAIQARDGTNIRTATIAAIKHFARLKRPQP